MSGEIEVQIPWMRYDITLPLMQGRVPITGVKLVPSLKAPAGTIFGPESPMRSGDFGLVDLNMANWLPAIEAGWELVGLPIFSKRKHLYTYLFCRADRGIAAPKDLEGKRILSAITWSAVAVWLRGFLAERHGVDLGTITWVSSSEQWPLYADRWKIEPLKARKNVLQVLLDGDADAAMVDVSDRKLFAALESNPRIKRVFPDYFGETRRLFEETGIYPPVHMVVMSRKLDRLHPDLGAKLVAAFEQAKQISYEEMLDDRSGFALVDLRERFVAQQRDWGDIFPHGITANRRTIDWFVGLVHKTGTIKRVPSYSDIFATSTLNT